MTIMVRKRVARDRYVSERQEPKLTLAKEDYGY